MVCFSQVDREKSFQLTIDFIRQLQNRNFDSISFQFDSVMSRQFDSVRLKEVWEYLPVQYGEIRHFGKTSIDTLPGFTVSVTPIQFEKIKLAVIISFDHAHKIAGLYFRPRDSYIPPEYINTLSFLEYKINFGTAPYILQAIFSVPRNIKNPPCVIILGGSGPTDKDMTHGDNKPYKDISWGLASKGVAVFRFDKRTASHGSQISFDTYAGKHLTIKEEYIDDANAAIEYLRKSKMIDPKRIFIIGHSEGGMVAPLISKRNKKVKGIVMLAANARKMQDLLIDQLNFLEQNGEYNPEQKLWAKEMKRKALRSIDPNLKPDVPDDSLPGATAAYWISLNNYNQVETAQKLNRPMLFLQGERDYQVTLTDFNIWKEKLKDKKNCMFKSYPKINHHLMEGEGKPSSAEYEKRGNVPEYIVDDIASWIKSIK